VLAPREAVLPVADLLTGSPDVRVYTSPGGHLGVLTGRGARETTWRHLDAFLRAYDERREGAAPAGGAAVAPAA
jgi:polyhydroxyalkanoate synthase